MFPSSVGKPKEVAIDSINEFVGITKTLKGYGEFTKSKIKSLLRIVQIVHLIYTTRSLDLHIRSLDLHNSYPRIAICSFDSDSISQIASCKSRKLVNTTKYIYIKEC